MFSVNWTRKNCFGNSIEKLKRIEPNAAIMPDSYVNIFKLNLKFISKIKQILVTIIRSI
jgi:hypothetical protein